MPMYYIDISLSSEELHTCENVQITYYFLR